ncbi:hypothetical protein ID866_2249 [Astraeus odoratus]|nr:hypothetical protein ID866_2249 [Astraeus odoratus]
MEVESASRVVDGAIVLIDSVEGVEAQTKAVWGQLSRYGVSSRLIFMNKLDRPGASFRASMLSLITHGLHSNPLAITLPVASFKPDDYARAEPGIVGLVDLVGWQLWKWTADKEHSIHPLPQSSDPAELEKVLPSGHPLIPHLIPARTALLENLAMFSDELMEQLLAFPSESSYLQVQQQEVLRHLRKATLENRTLRSQSTLFNVNTGQKEKVSKLLLLYASQAEEVDSLPYGSVGVLLGLRFTRTGDTLVSGRGQEKFASEQSLRGVAPPPAVMSASVIPNSHSDLEPVQEAIRSLIRTDPSVRMDTQDGQILVHGLGALHLEIIGGRLKDEWRANFEFGRRQVSYRESLASKVSSGLQEWSTEVAGKSVTVKVTLSIIPLDADEQGDPAYEGNLVLDSKGKPLVAPDTSPDQSHPLTNLARGISSALSSSPHTLLPYSHVKVQIMTFNLPRDAPPSILAGASSAIMRNTLKNAGMGPVLEPYIKLRISVHEDTIGTVVKDIIDNGGEILDLGSDATPAFGTEGEQHIHTDGVYIPPAKLSPSSTSPGIVGHSPHSKRTIHAIAPLSQMLDYSMRLRAISAGHGTFDMTNAGFRQVSESRKVEILRELGRA